MRRFRIDPNLFLAFFNKVKNDNPISKIDFVNYTFYLGEQMCFTFDFAKMIVGSISWWKLDSPYDMKTIRRIGLEVWECDNDFFDVSEDPFFYKSYYVHILPAWIEFLDEAEELDSI